MTVRFVYITIDKILVICYIIKSPSSSSKDLNQILKIASRRSEPNERILRMKTLTIILLCAVVLAVTGCQNSQIKIIKTSSVELKPNPGAMDEELKARMDSPLRKLTFYWDYVEGQPDLPVMSDFTVDVQHAADLIDKVAIEHMGPAVDPDTGKLNRRLVGVTVGEPMMATSPYGVPEVDWVTTQNWLRN